MLQRHRGDILFTNLLREILFNRETSNKFFFFFFIPRWLCLLSDNQTVFKFTRRSFQIVTLVFSLLCLFIRIDWITRITICCSLFSSFFFFFKSSIREIRVLLNRIKENRHEKFFCFLRDIFPDLFIHLLRSCTETYFYRRVVTTWWCLTFL